MDFSNFIDGIARAAEQSNGKREGDFINAEDGLLYCGKCNTPKQCKVNLFGVDRIVYCICKCRQEQLAAEEAEQKRIERMRHIQRLRKLGFADDEMQHWTFDADDHQNSQITKIAHNYVDNFAEMKKRGKGLLLFGTVGTGKTFISACIANALIDKGHPCLVTNFARLVNTIQGTFDGKQDYIDSLNQFDLIVIDDLASERDTEYMGEIVQNIIDSRYRAGLPLIITTNLTSDELKHAKEIRKQRIYSRLFEMCVPVEVKLLNKKGEPIDRRRLKLKSEIDDLRELLEINMAENN
jgi:DNA replication protein DnaC